MQFGSTLQKLYSKDALFYCILVVAISRSRKPCCLCDSLFYNFASGEDSRMPVATSFTSWQCYGVLPICGFASARDATGLCKDGGRVAPEELGMIVPVVGVIGFRLLPETLNST
jgi:hypothetical protein